MPVLHDKVKYLGNFEHSADFLTMVDAVLLPSAHEGGPIVLLEAWAARVPFFMRRTGLAVEHPDGIVEIGGQGARSAAEVAALVADSMRHPSSGAVAAAVAAGYAAVSSAYSTDAVSAQYNLLLENVVRCSSRDEVWLDPKPTAVLTGRSAADARKALTDRTSVLEQHGKQVQLQCMREGGCSFVLVSRSPPACAVSSWMPKFVHVVFELFEQSSQMRQALSSPVRVTFAAEANAPLPAEGDWPPPLPLQVDGGRVSVHTAIPNAQKFDASPFMGVARFHITVPPMARLQVAQVEWRERPSS